MSTIQRPTIINLTSDDMIEAIQGYVRSKYPNLLEEEFEVEMRYDTYNYIHSTTINFIDNGEQ